MELIIIISMAIFILTIKFLHHYSIYRLSRKVCNSCLLNGHVIVCQKDVKTI